MSQAQGNFGSDSVPMLEDDISKILFLVFFCCIVGDVDTELHRLLRCLCPFHESWGGNLFKLAFFLQVLLKPRWFWRAVSATLLATVMRIKRNF